MGLRWGILGTGGIAGAMAKDLNKHGFELGAVGSRTAASAEEFAAKHGVPRSHGSYEELAADPEVDAIYVATPHPQHLPAALVAIRGGKHVLVEKPLTVNAEEARQLYAAAEERGVVALEAMWTRFLPPMVRFRELLRAGELGEIRTVIAEHDQDLPKDPAHRLNDPALGGGALLDLGIYPVSFAWDVLGAPSEVRALSTATATGVDRQTSILLGYPSGAHALLSCAMDVRAENRAVVYGTEGRVEFDGPFMALTSWTRFDRRGEVVERWDAQVEGHGFQFEAAELERLVAEGRSDSDVLTPGESIAIMGLLDEVRAQIGLRYPGE